MRKSSPTVNKEGKTFSDCIKDAKLHHAELAKKYKPAKNKNGYEYIQDKYLYNVKENN